ELRRRNMPLSEIRRAVVGVPAKRLSEVRGSALAYIDSLIGSLPQAKTQARAGTISGTAQPTMAGLRAPSGEPDEAQGMGERWRRIRLHPDVELAIREPLPPALASSLTKVVARLNAILEGRED